MVQFKFSESQMVRDTQLLNPNKNYEKMQNDFNIINYKAQHILPLVL